MRFCVECGKDVENTVRGMCMECFLKDRPLVALPDHVDLNVCTECGQYERHGEYVSLPMEKAIRQAARDVLTCVKEGRVTHVETEIDARDDYNHLATLNCTVEIEGFEVQATASTIVRIKHTVCRICSRRTGNYYESILQIRGTGRELDRDLQDRALARAEKLVDLAATTDSNAFITKMELVPGGVDVYLSLIALGRACCKDIADLFCAETDESSKLVGQTRDGLDMYRVSYLVRLPDFEVGDVVTFRKRYYMLKRVSSQGGRLVSMKDFKEMPVKRQDMPEVKVYAKRSEAVEAVVVSRSKGEIQVMDPSTYATLDLRVPEYAEIGETVLVLRIDDVLQYVPDYKN